MYIPMRFVFDPFLCTNSDLGVHCYLGEPIQASPFLIRCSARCTFPLNPDLPPTDAGRALIIV